MEIAMVDGRRELPRPHSKGLCPRCEQPVQSKCGSKIMWHWAHIGKCHCDPWWENETEWHRAWKSLFPENQREIIQYDQLTGEKHVADIQTRNDLVIELQHSPMPIEELKSRENFYKRMIWIVDAQVFGTNFDVCNAPLPDPKADICTDIRFHGDATMFWRLSERQADTSMVEIHSSRKIASEILAHYKGHHFFKWTRPRTIWFEAKNPVFLDFGGDELLWLQVYDDLGQRCVRRVSKRALVEKNGGKLATHDQFQSNFD